VQHQYQDLKDFGSIYLQFTATSRIATLDQHSTPRQQISLDQLQSKEALSPFTTDPNNLLIYVQQFS